MATHAAPESAPRTVPDLISGGRTIAMVMTMIGNQHSSRPLTCADVADDHLSFLVAADVDWVRAIEQGSTPVHVSVADEKHNVYLSLNGHARISHDRQEKDRLWTKMAEAWFDGPEDPRLAVLQFAITSGEYWDGPGSRVGQGVAMLKAMVTGDGASVGDKGPISTR